MLELIKYYDGNLSQIDAIPEHLKHKHQEAFQIDPEWLIDITAVRGKWIDQSQSHNVFMQGVSGKKLDALYKYGWKKGLKTFYYLRTLGASQIEKSTLDAKKFGYTQKREYSKVEEVNSVDAVEKPATEVGKACSVLDSDCEACQ